MLKSVFIATSLDGFIARTDGSIDWLNEANNLVPPNTDLGYAKFFASIDTLIMGRNTFELVLTFGEWPYKEKPVIVLSRELKTVPSQLPPSVSVSNESPQHLVERLAGQGRQHLYIDGGLTIQSFLRAHLIDELTITVIPVLLGSGKPLFGELASDIRLDLVSSQSFAFGFVQNVYRVKK